MISRAKCLLVIFILVAIPFVSFAQAPNLRENFAKAYALYSSGNLTQAKELFQQALEPGFLARGLQPLLSGVNLVQGRQPRRCKAVSFPAQETLFPKYLVPPRPAATSKNRSRREKLYPGQ